MVEKDLPIGGRKFQVAGQDKATTAPNPPARDDPAALTLREQADAAVRPPPRQSPVRYGEVSWERMIGAVEKVRERLQRAVAALEAAGVPYAVAGGNAVAAWVSRVDEAAVRNTRDVDILLRRTDLAAAIAALAGAGFVHRHVASLDMFLDGANARARDAVHIVFASEKVRPESPAPAPDVAESEQTASFRLLALEALVRMKLTSYRHKDCMHLLDLIAVGLVDTSWCARLPAELAMRLQHLLENPEG